MLLGMADKLAARARWNTLRPLPKELVRSGCGSVLVRMGTIDESTSSPEKKASS